MPKRSKKDDDDVTDDEEEIEDVPWKHLDERPKMPTIYSYALAGGGNPKVNEGPHTVASLVTRKILEDRIEAGDGAGLTAMYEAAPTHDDVAKILEEEVPDEDLRGKLDLYKGAYKALHAGVKKRIAKLPRNASKADLKDVALELWKLENLNPRAVYGWKTALRGETVSSRSSATKGERLRVRLKKQILSATRSQKLVDSGGSRSFVDSDAAVRFQAEKLQKLFGSTARVKRYLESAKAAKRKKKAKKS